jgi:hypothetical protein
MVSRQAKLIAKPWIGIGLFVLVLIVIAACRAAFA